METTIIENATYYITTTSVLGTTLSKSTKSNKNLLFSIKMVGGIDIILLSAHLALCIYDRKGREKTTIFFHLVSNPADAVRCMKILKLFLFVLLDEVCKNCVTMYYLTESM